MSICLLWTLTPFVASVNLLWLKNGQLFFVRSIGRRKALTRICAMTWRVHCSHLTVQEIYIFSPIYILAHLDDDIYIYVYVLVYLCMYIHIYINVYVFAIIKNICVFLYMMCIINLYFVYILSGKRSRSFWTERLSLCSHDDIIITVVVVSSSFTSLCSVSHLLSLVLYLFSFSPHWPVYILYATCLVDDSNRAIGFRKESYSECCVCSSLLTSTIN